MDTHSYPNDRTGPLVDEEGAIRRPNWCEHVTGGDRIFPMEKVDEDGNVVDQWYKEFYGIRLKNDPDSALYSDVAFKLDNCV